MWGEGGGSWVFLWSFASILELRLGCVISWNYVSSVNEALPFFFVACCGLAHGVDSGLVHQMDFYWRPVGLGR